MFEKAEVGELDLEAIRKLAALLIGSPESSTGNCRIRAGYTYLGQCIDHDITFDPTSSLDPLTDLDALVNFRTPRLDLDSLYGTGPLDQPFLSTTGTSSRTV